MRIDIDTYREIIDTLTRNKSRSFLTGFGVFWGVFMLVALMGGGKGLKEKLDKNFEGFAQNTVIIGTNQTTKPYKGFRKGRWWVMEYKLLTTLLVSYLYLPLVPDTFKWFVSLAVLPVGGYAW